MNIKYNANNKYSFEIAIRLSLQRALLCEVSSNLRMVAVDWNHSENTILIFFYFDKSVSGENKESANCICAEVSGDFDPTTQVIDKCALCDFPNRLPDHSLTVYRRKE